MFSTWPSPCSPFTRLGNKQHSYWVCLRSTSISYTLSDFKNCLDLKCTKFFNFTNTIFIIVSYLSKILKSIVLCNKIHTPFIKRCQLSFFSSLRYTAQWLTYIVWLYLESSGCLFNYLLRLSSLKQILVLYKHVNSIRLRKWRTLFYGTYTLVLTHFCLLKGLLLDLKNYVRKLQQNYRKQKLPLMNKAGFVQCRHVTSLGNTA